LITLFEIPNETNPTVKTNKTMATTKTKNN
jgi:hypothetical protein